MKKILILAFHDQNNSFKISFYSGRIFIVMLLLYSTREDTKIWAKIIFACAKKCSRIEGSVADGKVDGGQKGNSEQTSRGMNA